MQTQECEQKVKPGVLNEVACPSYREKSPELTEDPQQRQESYQRRFLVSHVGNNYGCVYEQTGAI